MLVTRMHFDTGQHIYADQARAKTASLLEGTDQPALVKKMMNYDPASDRSVAIKGFPPVQFHGARTGFALLGFGEAGFETLMQLAPTIARGWSDSVNAPVLIRSTEQRPCSLTREQYAIRYRIPRLIVQKEKLHLERLKDPASGRSHLEGIFERSLRSQAAFLGIDVPEDLEVSFIEAAGEFTAKNSHSGAHLLGLKGAVFEVNATLAGYWVFGYLKSKGYGLLNADLARGGKHA